MPSDNHRVSTFSLFFKISTCFRKPSKLYLFNVDYPPQTVQQVFKSFVLVLRHNFFLFCMSQNMTDIKFNNKLQARKRKKRTANCHISIFLLRSGENKHSMLILEVFPPIKKMARSSFYRRYKL